MARGFDLFPHEPGKLPQFGGGAPPVQVRNTFLHIDDTPLPQAQSRHKSAPPDALRRSGPADTGWGNDRDPTDADDRRRFATDHAAYDPVLADAGSGYAAELRGVGAMGLEEAFNWQAAAFWPSSGSIVNVPPATDPVQETSFEASEGWSWGHAADAWPSSMLYLDSADAEGSSSGLGHLAYAVPPPSLPPSLPPQLQTQDPEAPPASLGHCDLFLHGLQQRYRDAAEESDGLDRAAPASVPSMPRLAGALGGARAAPAFVPSGHSALPIPSSPLPAPSMVFQVPQPQTLTRAISATTEAQRVLWTVDARKLTGNDKQAVSPPFELCFGHQGEGKGATFKMMLYPKLSNDSKGSSTFKRCNGRGFVLLKCEAEFTTEIVPISFRIAIGMGDRRQPARGPATHDFSKSAVCGLPPSEEEWCFNDVVDFDSMTFVICLEIVPGGARR